MNCLRNSTANPAQFGWKWAGLAAGNSQTAPTIFFIFSAYFFFSKNIPQTTFAVAFLTHIILAICGVDCHGQK